MSDKRPARGDRSWMDRAKCKGMPRRLFFDRTTVTKAKAVCAVCPVKAQCEEFGGSDDGVWGGLTQAERMRKRRRQVSSLDEKREQRERAEAFERLARAAFDESN